MDCSFCVYCETIYNRHRLPAPNCVYSPGLISSLLRLVRPRTTVQPDVAACASDILGSSNRIVAWSLSKIDVDPLQG